ncbi:hypothetical protein [Maridesulfovibrio sp.]|uniref:hypothetical protein n=1 Tax=Maridesulfovibrio sp. TaxID=2795000 RepID=UPI002AA68097|nr:hypothetical protein [Maridesulfovibrio sp.]
MNDEQKIKIIREKMKDSPPANITKSNLQNAISKCAADIKENGGVIVADDEVKHIDLIYMKHLNSNTPQE